MSDEQTPSLRGLLDRVLAQGLEGLRVSLPGRVEAYDAATQKADVQPLVKRRVVDAAGVTQVERLPVVPSVPVMFPGAGPYSITFPVAVGDVVLLVFADASLDLWLARGGEVDPEDTRAHAHTDAIAIPGLRPFADPVSPAPPSSAMVITADEVRLGSSTAADPVALKSDLDALKAAYDAHIHPDPASGFTGVPTVGAPTPACATKVKAE